MPVGKFARSLLDAGQRQRVHSPCEELPDYLDGMRIAPVLLPDGVEPDRVRPLREHALQPDSTGLLVPMPHRTAGIGNLVRAHRGVADEDHLVVMPVFVKDVPGRNHFRMAPPIVLPYALVEAV